MGMTIGQGLILGSQNYINAQETERRRKWEDEERARQRKAWTARDETMAQIKNVGTERAMGNVPAENWQDPPVATRQAALDPQQRYEQQQRILSSSEDPALMAQGIGMYPQVEQGKELAYQRNLRDKRNAAAKQYSDMLSAINEGRNGVHSGELHPAVAMKALGSFQSASLAVAGMPGQERWAFIDNNGKAEFRPITKTDVLKLLDEAEANVRKMYDNALMGLSAEDVDKVRANQREDQKTVLEAKKVGVLERGAAVAERGAAVAEQKLPYEIAETEAKTGMYKRLPAASSSGGPPLTKEEKAELGALAEAYKAAKTPAERQKIAGDIAVAQAAMSIKRGVPAPLLKDPGDVTAFRAMIADYFKTNGKMPDENTILSMAEVMGLPVSDPIMDAIRKAGGLAPKPAAEQAKVDRSNREAQTVASIARMPVAELQAMIAQGSPYAAYAQRELDIRSGKARTQAIEPPPYSGILPDR